MPLYIDIHNLPGVTPDDVAKAHSADVRMQDAYGVQYVKYWVNEQSGKVFCLCDAPSAEAATTVHRQAHGLVAERIIEVTPELTEMFMGAAETNAAGAVMLPGQAATKHDPGVRTVLFTDIVGSTTITQTLGDEAAMELVHLHDRIVRDAIAAGSGREIKHTGDGIMAAFLSPVAAMRCAISAQRELANAARESDGRLEMRIGAAAGEPVEHHDDLFGATVQLAARLCAHASPSEILVSNVVADLCLGKGVVFEDACEVSLKGFETPISARKVRWATA